MHEIHRFLVALQFLSTLPIRFETPPDPDDTAGALPYYPLAGLLIGGLLVVVARITENTPHNLHAAIVLTVWVLLTGGLHLDGLADSADAWVGGLGDRAKALAIMKDPCCGPAAVVALVLVLLIKFAALQSLLSRNEWESLLAAPVLARNLLILLFLTTPYVRPYGLGSPISERLPRRKAMTAILIVVALLPWFFGIDAIRLLLSTGITFFVLRILMLRRLGGTTGDTAGALVEITETVAVTTTVFSATGIFFPV